MANEKSQRNTRQRQMILEILADLRIHPTASELYQLVRQQLPHISLGTIYRNLDQLSAAGVIHKLDHAGGQVRYDGNLDCHDHIRCLLCGRIDDVYNLPPETATTRLKTIHGYTVLDCRLELTGICRECSEATGGDGKVSLTKNRHEGKRGQGQSSRTEAAGA
jgi:Fur family ferric uptake transcriptional regulator